MDGHLEGEMGCASLLLQISMSPLDIHFTLPFFLVSLLISVKMVMLWTAGDIFKTSYFIIKATPAQFWMCGALQICLDVLILLQVWYYNQQPHAKFG